MHILDKIVSFKRKEIDLKKSIISINQLEKSELFTTHTNSLSRSIINSDFGIIAEFKRKSPSKSVINDTNSVQEVVLGYEKAKVSGISVLTDNYFFGGSTDDLLQARASVKTPILRKEFIIDEFQIIEAKAIGSDAILLIAAILTSEQITTFSKLAKSLSLDVLLEIHNLEELQKCNLKHIDIIGVNNRNLKTFEVSIQNSVNLVNEIPEEFVKISESGISSKKAILELKSCGYKGFLIGENFMKTKNPGENCINFLTDLKL